MINKIYTQIYQSPIGELLLGDFEGKLCLCDWNYRKMRTSIDERIAKVCDAKFEEKVTEITGETIRQLSAYFSGERTLFDLPLKMIGTEFQRSVWTKLVEIEYGEAQSYQWLAKALDKEKAIRAVAAANGANALSIIVPCHRIVGSDGKLVGYAGGLRAKKMLLELEGSLHKNQLRLF